jgi:hypothetical protein
LSVVPVAVEDVEGVDDAVGVDVVGATVVMAIS